MKYIILIFSLSLVACQEQENVSDAYGNFEAREIFVSAEGSGKILSYTVNEGDFLEAGQQLAQLDTMPMYLQEQSILARMSALKSKHQNIRVQERIYDEQENNLLREKTRLQKLLVDGAATPKQLDDVNGLLAVVERKKEAHISSLTTANRGLSAELEPLRAQVKIIKDKISRQRVISPASGTVLISFAEQGEMTSVGKPLCKLADTREMWLRAYVTGAQLPEIAIAKEVKLSIDGAGGKLDSLAGKITWISQRAEFTPKTIQTREARVDQVYAIKIRVLNPKGTIKIGMPAEVSF